MGFQQKCTVGSYSGEHFQKQNPRITEDGQQTSGQCED